MTTVTCHRNRIVSPAEISPIRRYVLSRLDIFSTVGGSGADTCIDGADEDGNKTRDVWKISGQHHTAPARAARTKETQRRNSVGHAFFATVSCKAVLLIFCHPLAFTTSHRDSRLPGTYQHVTRLFTRASRVSSGARDADAAARSSRLFPG